MSKLTSNTSYLGKDKLVLTYDEDCSLCEMGFIDEDDERFKLCECATLVVHRYPDGKTLTFYGVKP